MHVSRRPGVVITEELIMSLIGGLVGYALTAFILLLLARMVLDWSGVLASGPQWASRVPRCPRTALNTRQRPTTTEHY
jgi:hypothetical protein